MPLQQIVVEKTALQLLKPATYEILQNAPYVQVVFLYCFVNLNKEGQGESNFDEKTFENYIVKGYPKVSYKQKQEFYFEYQDSLLQDHLFRNKVMNRVQRNPFLQ